MTKVHFENVDVSINELIPYARNSRTHSDEQIAQVASSIKEFGFTNPVIIDEDNGIIAGHGRVMAAKLLSFDDVPCIQVTGWSEAQKKAYVIADNKLALNSGWDQSMLKIELQELEGMDFDLSLTGFNFDELGDLLVEDEEMEFEPATEEEQGKLDELEPKMVNCPHCDRDFDSRGREIK